MVCLQVDTRNLDRFLCGNIQSLWVTIPFILAIMKNSFCFENVLLRLVVF